MKLALHAHVSVGATRACIRRGNSKGHRDSSSIDRDVRQGRFCLARSQTPSAVGFSGSRAVDEATCQRCRLSSPPWGSRVPARRSNRRTRRLSSGRRTRFSVAPGSERVPNPQGSRTLEGGSWFAGRSVTLNSSRSFPCTRRAAFRFSRIGRRIRRERTCTWFHDETSCAGWSVAQLPGLMQSR